MVDDFGRLRRLKAYEAEPIPIHKGREDSDPTLFSPFGPLIGRCRLDQSWLDLINRSADAHVQADQSIEFALPQELLQAQSPASGTLLQTLSRSIVRYVERVQGRAPSQLTFEHVWVVSQVANTASPVHFHSGDVSGILYLKVPSLVVESPSSNYILGRRQGQINFLHGGKQLLSRSLISFAPVVGDLYLFPSWLLHGVEPFDGNGERRSLSFNVILEE
ncbi:MAG: putative 2OG-Fe(II) oxygenase [Cyanobacteriota bacterium]